MSISFSNSIDYCATWCKQLLHMQQLRRNAAGPLFKPCGFLRFSQRSTHAMKAARLEQRPEAA